MSWLSDIAGKAETFLNAMDKSAASAISSATTVVQSTDIGAILSPGSKDLGTPSGPPSRRHSRKHSMRSNASRDANFGFDTEFIETPDIMSLKTSTSTNSLYSSNGNGTNKGHQRNSSFGSVGSRDGGVSNGTPKNKVNNLDGDDDHLMDFLNSKESTRNNIPEEEWQNQNQTNSSDLHPTSFDLGDDATTTTSTEEVAEESEGLHSDHSDQQTPANVNKNSRIHQVKIAALSKELSGLQARYADLLSEYKSLQKRAVSFHNQNMTTEKALKEARSREADLQAALQTKDGQVAALKVALESVEGELKQKTASLGVLEAAKRALEEELSRANLELQSQNSITSKSPPIDPEVVAALEFELSTLKTTLTEEREEAKRLVEIHRETLSRLEDTQRSLVEQLEGARREVADAKRAEAEAAQAAAPAQARVRALDAELTEFRAKASRTLADKDEVIRRLQASSGASKEDDQVQQSGETGSQDQYIQLLQEQAATLARELADLQATFSTTRAALDKVEGETLPLAQREAARLRDEIAREQTASTSAQAEAYALGLQARAASEELASLRTSLSARIAERDEEIEKLRRQLVAKQQKVSSSFQMSSSTEGFSPSTEEWEGRLKTLTESLIGKQAAVEQLSSANHSLKLQLERAEQRLREMASSGTTLNNDVAIGIYHSPTFTNYIKHRMTGNAGGDNGSSSSLLSMEEGPNDGQVTRKVKRAYGAIDAFSIRLGNFLRVYPSARAAFLVYILILHLWVAFVLIYYEPEVHSLDFHHTGGDSGSKTPELPKGF